jgi:hypothetical protein
MSLHVGAKKANRIMIDTTFAFIPRAARSVKPRKILRRDAGAAGSIQRRSTICRRAGILGNAYLQRALHKNGHPRESTDGDVFDKKPSR